MGADNGFCALLCRLCLGHYRPCLLVVKEDLHYEDKNKTNKANEDA
ncbi:hypothetical protein DESC_270044 [Desulfosarcina cetonica]|nr:hypothetical protein DESC_270044 [Desulfosarcina cetonica]